VNGQTKDLSAVPAKYEAGDSVNALRLEYGVRHETIEGVLVAAGVQLRSRSTAISTWHARSTEEARRRRTAAASAANAFNRGRPAGLAVQCAKARALEAAGRFASPYEEMLAGWLRARGLAVIPQQAIGPYNADLGSAPVAIEVLGSMVGLQGKKLESRVRRVLYFLEAGWQVLLVLCVSGPGASIAGSVLAEREALARLPPGKREWRILDGSGAVVARGCVEDGAAGLKVALACCRRSLRRRK